MAPKGRLKLQGEVMTPSNLLGDERVYNDACSNQEEGGSEQRSNATASFVAQNVGTGIRKRYGVKFGC